MTYTNLLPLLRPRCLVVVGDRIHLATVIQRSGKCRKLVGSRGRADLVVIGQASNCLQLRFLLESMHR